jgi:aspartate beta-hydroxylase
MFILNAYGNEVAENMRACPQLVDLIRKTPEVLSAALSLLGAHKYIPPHRGPFNGILRFHLMLDVPLDSDDRPAVVYTIDGRRFRPADGHSLLWDDTYRHEVRNLSDRIRIALLLDVVRPPGSSFSWPDWRCGSAAFHSPPDSRCSKTRWRVWAN